MRLYPPLAGLLGVICRLRAYPVDQEPQEHPEVRLNQRSAFSTAPHRTAPHRTAPHRTAPHRTAAKRMVRSRAAAPRRAAPRVPEKGWQHLT